MPTFTYTNYYLEQRDLGNVNWGGEAPKFDLMASGYSSFDQDATNQKANFTANRLATGFGYTQGAHSLANVSVDVDAANDRVDVNSDPTTLTASGGSIGPTPGAMYYLDTADIVIGYLAFDSEETATDGNDFVLTHPIFRTSKA